MFFSLIEAMFEKIIQSFIFDNEKCLKKNSKTRPRIGTTLVQD